MATSKSSRNPPTWLQRIGAVLGATVLLYLALGLLRSLHLVKVENSIGHDIRDVLLVLDGSEGRSGQIANEGSAWILIVHRPKNDTSFEVFIRERDAWQRAGRACYVGSVWSWHRLEIKSKTVYGEDCKIFG